MFAKLTECKFIFKIAFYRVENSILFFMEVLISPNRTLPQCTFVEVASYSDEIWQVNEGEVFVDEALRKFNLLQKSAGDTICGPVFSFPVNRDFNRLFLYVCGNIV